MKTDVDRCATVLWSYRIWYPFVVTISLRLAWCHIPGRSASEEMPGLSTRAALGLAL